MANLVPAQGEKNKKVSRYTTLDALRGSAALLVALFHLNQRLGFNLVPEGYLAVDLFFVLSGFVIALNYSKKLNGRTSLKQFMVKRFIRLYPLYFLGAAFGAIFVLRSFMHYDRQDWSLPSVLGSGVFSLLVIPTPPPLTPFVPAPLFPFNGPSWSLFFEILINILFALILFRLKNMWLVGTCILTGVYLGFRTSAPLWFSAGWSWPTIDIGMARALFSFTVGTLLWRWQGAQRGRESWLALLVVGTAAALMCLKVPVAFQQLFETCAVFFALPLLVFCGIQLEVPRAGAVILSFLGEISYAVYAIHLPLIIDFLYYTHRWQFSPALTMIVFLIGIIVLAYGAHVFFDIPIRRWLTQRARRSAQ